MATVAALSSAPSSAVNFFDSTTEIRRVGNTNEYVGRVHKTWANPDKGAFGGAGVMYMLRALILHATQIGFPTPVSFTCGFPGAPKEDNFFRIQTETVRKGRSLLFVRATMAGAKPGDDPLLVAQGMFASRTRQVDIFPPRALPGMSSPQPKSDDLVPLLPLIGMQGVIKHFEAHADLRVSKSEYLRAAVELRDLLANVKDGADAEAIMLRAWSVLTPDIWVAHKPDPALGGRRRRPDEVSMGYWSDVFMTMAQSALLPLDLVKTIPKLLKRAEQKGSEHLRDVVDGLEAPKLENIALAYQTGEDGEGRVGRKPGPKGMADVGEFKYLRPSTSSLTMHWLPLPPGSPMDRLDDGPLRSDDEDFKSSAVVLRVQMTAQARDVSEREVQMFLPDAQGTYQMVCVARQILFWRYLSVKL
ncbi:hypothetical protein DFJ74DRAFT_769673 [Hyaloraphidium curvatum]|nr:hypothetical protein DFJ74DRAFT_769673 [Hyaloraphidium curvatum]